MIPSRPDPAGTLGSPGAPGAPGTPGTLRRLFRVCVPALVSLLALGGLTVWARAGAAGRPAVVSAAGGRVFLPVLADATTTAAFFRLENTGGAPATVTAVSSPLAAHAMLARTVITDNAGHMQMGVGLEVPARSAVQMTPESTDVMLELAGRLRLGEHVPVTFTLSDGTAVEATAEVVRPLS